MNLRKGREQLGGVGKQRSEFVIVRDQQVLRKKK